MRWSKDAVRIRIQRTGDGPGVQREKRIPVELAEGQVRVRASYLLGKTHSHLLRLGPGEAALARAETHEHELVLFTALQLECSAVASIRCNGLADITEGNRLVDSRAIAGGEILDDLGEQPLQISHAQSLRKGLLQPLLCQRKAFSRGDAPL